MKKTIVAIGGGEIGRVKILSDGTAVQTELETLPIDEFMVHETGKNNPNLLFIGTASFDKNSYFDIVKRYFGERLKCHVLEPLKLIYSEHSFDEIKRKIFEADIIYVGGGDTTFMLNLWREKGVDRLLMDAYNKGCVLSGISAGAVCWFEYYDNSEDIDNIEKLDVAAGLGLIKGFAVPHFNRLDDVFKERLNQLLKQKKISGWAIDNCAAVVVQNEKTSFISARAGACVVKIPETM